MSATFLRVCLFVFFFFSCTSPRTTTVFADLDEPSEQEVVPDMAIPDAEEEVAEGGESESELLPDTDIDTHCPAPQDAGYPYHREDGSIHFCRPCDTPTAEDPDCVRSTWDDDNKKIYDTWLAGGFEDNDLVNECYPYPCTWNVTTTQKDDKHPWMHPCDTRINPDGWLTGWNAPQQAFMVNGKVGMYLMNSPVESTLQINDRRFALYDIATHTYTMLGAGNSSFAMGNDKIFNSLWDGRETYWYEAFFADGGPVTYKAVYAPPEGESGSFGSGAAAMNDRWVVWMPRYQVNPSLYHLLYGKTKEGTWHTLGDTFIFNTQLNGDRLLFLDNNTTQTYLCDLSKLPSKISDCTRLGREGEIATFALFNRSDPNEVLYWSYPQQNAPGTEFVILDTGTTPFTIKKTFTITPTEATFTRQMTAQVYDGDVLLYQEEYINDQSFYDMKICFYRFDEQKSYCGKKMPDYTMKYYGSYQGWGMWEGKYLFWQGYLENMGYYVRDMECYCKTEGDDACPFPEYRGSENPLTFAAKKVHSPHVGARNGGLR